MAELKRRSEIYHPNLIRILGWSTKKEDLFCAEHYKISLYFDSFEMDLEEEINSKKQKNEKFDETELWYLFDSIVSVLAFFQESQVKFRGRWGAGEGRVL